VSHRTQEPPSEFLPAEPGIQQGASWRTTSKHRADMPRLPVLIRGWRRGECSRARLLSVILLSEWSAPGWVEALIPGKVRGYGTPEEVLR
jgi:hypothetical protein